MVIPGALLSDLCDLALISSQCTHLPPRNDTNLQEERVGKGKLLRGAVSERVLESTVWYSGWELKIPHRDGLCERHMS